MINRIKTQDLQHLLPCKWDFKAEKCHRLLDRAGGSFQIMSSTPHFTFHSCSLYKLVDITSFAPDTHPWFRCYNPHFSGERKLKGSGILQRMDSLANRKRTWWFSASTKVHDLKVTQTVRDRILGPPEPLWHTCCLVISECWMLKHFKTYLVSLLFFLRLIFHLCIYSLIWNIYYVPGTVYSLGSSKSIKETNISKLLCNQYSK